jgi:hypothetical protein
VRSTSADVSIQRIEDLGTGGSWVLSKQCRGPHQNTRQAVAALTRLLADEAFQEWICAAGSCERLDRFDIASRDCPDG